MTITHVLTFWNALITALLKCVAALGFAVPSTAPLPATPRPETTRGGATAFPSPRLSEPLPDRSLPPTTKQRIRAEAHGASPTVRSLPGDIADAGPRVNTPPDGPVPKTRWREWALCS